MHIDILIQTSKEESVEYSTVSVSINLVIRFCTFYISEKVVKSAWWMPWLSEAKKDVISCDKLRVGANNL